MKKASESQEPRKKKTHTHIQTRTKNCCTKNWTGLHKSLIVDGLRVLESECVSAKIDDAKLCNLVVSRAREKKRTTLGKRGDGGKTPATTTTTAATTTTNVGGQRRRGSDEGGRVGGR